MSKVDRFHALAKVMATHAETPLAVLGVGPAGETLFEILGPNIEQVERFAATLLNVVAEYATADGTDCPCCIDRERRARAAFIALSCAADLSPDAVAEGRVH